MSTDQELITKLQREMFDLQIRNSTLKAQLNSRNADKCAHFWTQMVLMLGTLEYPTYIELMEGADKLLAGYEKRFIKD